MNLKNIILCGIVVTVIVCLIMVLLSSRTHVIPAVETSRFPAEWTYYTRNDEGEHFYHPDESAKGSPGIVRVWTQVRFTSEGRNRYIQKRQAAAFKTEGYEALSHRNVLYELNCFSKKREYSTQEVFELTKEGKTLDYARAGTYKDWQEVPPGSAIDGLFQLVCPKRSD